jgi:hypothetical protein
MDPVVPQLLSHTAAEDNCLFLCPSKHSREQCQRQTLKSGVDVVEAPRPQLFIMFVLRPAVKWPLEPTPRNVDVSRIGEPTLDLVTGDHRATELRAGLIEENAQPGEIAILGECAIVRFIWDANLLEFDVAARLEVAGQR